MDDKKNRYSLIIWLSEFIIIPMFGIIDDIFSNALIGLTITDNVVVIPRLPGKTGIDFAGVDGNRRFKTTNNGCQVF